MTEVTGDSRETARDDRKDAPERRRIQSVSVGFRLVRALEAAGRPMTLTQLAAAAGMATSQAHLYLASYVHEGLVRQDESTSRYELGPYALQLGLAALRGLDVLALAREELERLRERSEESAHFSVWTERGPCIVLNVDGARPLPFSSRIGFILPPLNSATGRVFLAHLPARETAPVLAAAGAGAPDDPGVAALLDDVRRAGFSYTSSMVNTGLAAVSAPVFDHAARIRGVLTLIAPDGALTADPTSAPVTAVRASAAQLCARLGGPAAR
ncbi:MAG TPA: IclR family transcriptional regulator [Beijerinckiaceae bacterium]|jgi:DNA-binding IclR family transcriptional regulator